MEATLNLVRQPPLLEEVKEGVPRAVADLLLVVPAVALGISLLEADSGLLAKEPLVVLALMTVFLTLMVEVEVVLAQLARTETLVLQEALALLG
jgi:hypothetical protein